MSVIVSKKVSSKLSAFAAYAGVGRHVAHWRNMKTILRLQALGQAIFVDYLDDNGEKQTINVSADSIVKQYVAAQPTGEADSANRPQKSPDCGDPGCCENNPIV